MTGRLPETRTSRVVIAGTATYRDAALPTVPSVRANVEALYDLLTDRPRSSLTGAQCVALVDPADPASLMSALDAAAAQAEDLLLFYYSGHGFVEPTTYRLRLAVSNTVRDTFWTSVPFHDIATVLQYSAAVAKVVILDCCYSGLALQTVPYPRRVGQPGSDHRDTDGLYVVTATAGDWTAFAPEGQRHTTFTGELLDVLYKGLATEGRLLPLNAVFLEVRARLARVGQPEPQKEERNAAGNMALVRNTAYRTGRPVSHDLDRTLSRAVLVGTSEHDDPRLPAYPSARSDVDALADVLADPLVCGLPRDRCQRLMDWPTAEDILARIRAAADAAEDELIVYLTGQGILTPDGQWALPVRESNCDQHWTTLTATNLNAALAGGRARSTVVFVDASFSGRLAQMLDGVRDVTVLSSSGPHQLARVAGDRGAFTTALLRLLRHGLPYRPKHLTVLDVFQGLADGSCHLSVARSQRAYCLFQNRSTRVDPDAPHPCEDEPAPPA